MDQAFMIAAPCSGQGKTLISFALIRALSRRGLRVQAFKTGPDYIDGRFHSKAAGGRPCLNLDPWAMSPDRLRQIFTQGAEGRFPGGLATSLFNRPKSIPAQVALVEGAMGLFDGAENPREAGSNLYDTSSAALAKTLDLPLVLVIDCRGMAQSLAALVHGFTTFDPALKVSGLILNQVKSPKHERMLCTGLKLPVFGCLPPVEGLRLESRHLGLKQACELEQLDVLQDQAADWIEANLDVNALLQRVKKQVSPKTDKGSETLGRAQHLTTKGLSPLASNMSIAYDQAFGFLYPHVLAEWVRAGAKLHFFSPLKDEAPAEDAQAVYLPGGYPELYAAQLAKAQNFIQGLKAARDAGAWIYGECGGFMVLGAGLISRQGAYHKMTGLLPHSTSFQAPRLSLGYRQVRLLSAGPLGAEGAMLKAHEFHFSQLVPCQTGQKGQTFVQCQDLFAVEDASGRDLGVIGLRQDRVMGSYLHMIEQGSRRE